MLIILFRYRRLLTKTKVVVMIISSWLYGIFNHSLVQLTYRKNQPRLDVMLAVTILAFILPLLVILIMYGKVGKIAFTHRIRINATDGPNNNNAGRRSQSKTNKSALWLLAELKATRTLAVVVGAFVLCFIGYFVFLLRTTICHEWRNLQCKNAPPEVAIVLQWIKYFNSSLNPIIYTVMNNDMRKAMKRLVKGRITLGESSLELYTL